MILSVCIEVSAERMVYRWSVLQKGALSLPQQSAELDSFDFFSKDFIPHVYVDTNEIIQHHKFVSSECLQFVECRELCFMPFLSHCGREFCLNIWRGKHLH